jgi:hypothetical protein
VRLSGSVSGSELPPEVPWPAVVTVRVAPQLEAELVDRLEREPPERAVGVTDLLALRRAYHRSLGAPAAVSPTRQARIDQGRSVHRLLGTQLAREGTLEARVRREGIVGRIDILSELPIEVKTAGQLVDPNALPVERPDHVEQLGIYCALVEHRTGRLVTISMDESTMPEVQAVDLEFGSVESIRAEVARRRDLLRNAWAEHSPDRLPRCPWFGRGCEYQGSHACACTGEEPAGSTAIADSVQSIRVRNDVEERLRTALASSGRSRPPPVTERFREIVYPRRTYYERSVSLPSPAAAAPGEVAPTEPTAGKDLYARLTEALESGPPGEVARLPPRSDEPEEEVAGFRGSPLLVRTSRAWSRYRPEEMVPRSPQYALELGLRCAVTGGESGWLVLGYERAETDVDRLQVFEIRFDSVTPFSRMFRERVEGLRTALRDRAPARLPPCPSWMVADCPYRAECGCGDGESRATR